jgi:uncharacterized RDD family membrane protein YckC
MHSALQEDLLNIDELKIKYTYGTFWPRFWALLLDGLILAVLSPLVLYNKTEWKSGVLFVAITCIQIAYKPFFEYLYGATPGKMALKLRVVNNEYGKASFNEILLRNVYQMTGGLLGLVLGLSAFYQPASMEGSIFQNYSLAGGAAIAGGLVQLVIGILYLVDMGFLLNSAESRSLHDRIGKTYVIRTY